MFKRSVLMMIAVIALTITATVPAFAAPIAPTTGAKPCTSDHGSHLDGAVVTMGGKDYQCVNGQWVEVDDGDDECIVIIIVCNSSTAQSSTYVQPQNGYATHAQGSYQYGASYSYPYTEYYSAPAYSYYR